MERVCHINIITIDNVITKLQLEGGVSVCSQVAGREACIPILFQLVNPFTLLQRNHLSLLRVLMYTLSVHIVPLLAVFSQLVDHEWPTL